MRMFIPEIGTRIVLESDWTFMLHDEHRNEGVLKMLMAQDPDLAETLTTRRAEAHERWARAREARTATADEIRALGEAMHAARNTQVTLPAGSELSIDRIYIRRGVSEYSSITFNLTRTTHAAFQGKGKGRKRFWAKLAEVNQMEIAAPEAAAA